MVGVDMEQAKRLLAILQSFVATATEKTEEKHLIERRQGSQFLANFGPGRPLSLTKEGDKIRVTRGGKTVAWITKAGVIRAADSEQGEKTS